jgi:hypothetical protein
MGTHDPPDVTTAGVLSKTVASRINQRSSDDDVRAGDGTNRPMPFRKRPERAITTSEP